MKENVSIQLHVADIQASGTIDDVMKLSRDSEYTFFLFYFVFCCCFFVKVVPCGLGNGSEC